MSPPVGEKRQKRAVGGLGGAGKGREIGKIPGEDNCWWEVAESWGSADESWTCLGIYSDVMIINEEDAMF